MQTTLLGIAIAFILALVAALVGPFFIDWSQFRPQFEAEATRIVGAPVRVAGALDARLLPSPSLQLHGITIGGANDLGRVGADKLDVEFSLAALMRGEWRATELTVSGAAVDLGLNSEGKIDLPASTGPFNLGALAIDKLNLTGRAILHDAASRSTLELGDVVFSGDVRSLAAGAMRGDGNFTLSGTRYPFRMSSGQTTDGNGVRLRVTLDAGDKRPGFDADGAVTFAGRAPTFEGTLTLVSNDAPKSSNPRNLAWRVISKVKADASQALFESVEASYGNEDALKFVGVADLRFGNSPLLHAVMSAKQLDLDRWLAKNGGNDDKVTPIVALRRLMLLVPQPPVATQLEASVEQIMLGGRPVQNVGADLHGDARSWAVQHLEFRAPGATRAVLSGKAVGSGFSGALNIDSSDPDVLAVWLKGRSEARLRDQKPLRIRGNFASNTDGLSIDGLKADIDGGALEGRVALVFPSATGGSRIDAALKADRLDLDAAIAFVRSLGGPEAEWPDAGRLSLDIGRAISAGQEMQPFAARFAYGPKIVSLDSLKVGNANGLTIDGSGMFDRVDVTGKLSLVGQAPSLAKIAGVIAPFAPTMAARFETMSPQAGTARLALGVELTKPQRSPDRTHARLALDIDAPQLHGKMTLEASPSALAVRGVDADALSRSEWSMDTKLSGNGGHVLALLGLNNVLAASDASLALDANAVGPLRGPLRIKAKLSGAELDGDVQGTIEPWATVRKAAVTLAIRNANAAPMINPASPDAINRKVSLSSRVTLNGDKLSFDDIDSTIASARMRGKLSLMTGAEKSFDGQIGLDRMEVVPVFSLITGAQGRDPGEPLGQGILQGWRGQLAFQSLSALLPGGVEIRPVSGVLKSDGASLTVNTVKGKIGDGDLAADVDLRSAAATGYALTSRVELSGADGAALRYRSMALPAGKTSLRLSLTSQGRSASALTGALSGDGLLTIEGARIAGLDPRVFDVAIRASDSGQATDDNKLRQIVEQALPRGELILPSIQVPFSIKDSRLRVGTTTLEGDGARAIVSGGYDIVADQVDLRASLAGTAQGNSAARPEIQFFAVGTPDKLEQSIDVAALSSWLAVRAIDRETRRLDLLERGAAPSAVAPAAAVPSTRTDQPNAIGPSREGATNSVPVKPDVIGPGLTARPPRPAASEPVVVSPSMVPLPAPIEVRPAPGAARAQKQRPSAPLVLTPQP